VLKKLPLTFTNIQCPSTINQYINQPTSLYKPSSLFELVANYNIINFKKKFKKKYIQWVDFNKHKDHVNN